MSSAVLYLAIVAIWAGFLVPAWIRRPNAARSAGDRDFTAESETDAELNHSGPGSLDPESEYADDVPGRREGVPAGSRAPAARRSESREQMLRYRRRVLAILATLTVLVCGLAGVGLAAWWICVPPAGLLVVYLLLLREIAMADAEMATQRRQAQAARAARQRARQAWAASHSEPTAQIIDISGRVGDQLYDQYADAAVRAVGD